MNLFKILKKSLKEADEGKIIPMDDAFWKDVMKPWNEWTFKRKFSYVRARIKDKWIDFKLIPYNLRRTFQYFRIIYKTHHEWDYDHLINFLIFKLERMEKHHFNNHWHMDHYYVAEEISEVIKCLKAYDDSDRHERILNKYGREKEGYKKLMEFEQQTFERAFELLGKQMRGWWD